VQAGYRGLASSAAAGKGSSAVSMYDALFSSNARYVLFVVVGAAAGEAVYGFVGDSLWHMNNRGKLYEDVDWSKWESLYMGEDEDEDEDEEGKEEEGEEEEEE